MFAREEDARILVTSLLAATVVALLFKFACSPSHKNGISFPPGPPAKWFWQDQFAKEDMTRALDPLFEKYGPVISLRRGNDVTIVIGRMVAVNEIMEKEGAALADRPRNLAASEILSRGMRLTLARAGDRFRRLRRAAHTHLQPKVAETHNEFQAAAAKEVILDILNDPKQHMHHARRFAAAVILRVTYGKTSQTTIDDPDVMRIREVTKNFQVVLRPGAYLVDRIPWLRYLPGYDFHLQKRHQYELALFREHLNKVKSEMAVNEANSSFVKTLLENTDDHRLSDDEIAYLAGNLYAAGSDPTAMGITVMIMAAACHPDAQAHVQEELDEVVGRYRVPTFADKDMLPQLHAFMLEALRWRPLSPLGFAHRATKDIVWKEHCIPAGASVFGCSWAISRDPDAFPDPESFNPQRWLTDDGGIRTDMRVYTFGFGRRECPGQHLASRSLFINLACLLWSFRIQQRPEAPIVETARSFQNPVVFHPEPFEVAFIPRMKEQRLRELMA